MDVDFEVGEGLVFGVAKVRSASLPRREPVVGRMEGGAKRLDASSSEGLESAAEGVSQNM